MTADEFLTSMPDSADDADGMQRPHALDPAMSLADYAAATASTPEAVGRTLRVLADRHFTGEAIIEFPDTPGAVVRIHVDSGQPYVAERAGDEPLGRRLVASGVIEPQQLQRGMVPVGDVEHLGRLFQRERTIDRNAVIGAVETMTDELLTQIAAEPAIVTITPYRHHRSGIHRWFVGPQRTEAAVPHVGDSTRPFDPPQAPGQVAEPAPSIGTDAAGDALRVEWAEPIPAFEPPTFEQPTFEQPIDELTDHSVADVVGDGTEIVPVGEFDDIDISAEIDGFDADTVDWQAIGPASFAPPVPASPAPESTLPEPTLPEPTVSEPNLPDPALPAPTTSWQPPQPIVDEAPQVDDAALEPPAVVESEPEPDEPTDHVEVAGTAGTDIDDTDDTVIDDIDDIDDTDDTDTVAVTDDIDTAPTGDFTMVWPDGSAVGLDAPSTGVADDADPVVDLAVPVEPLDQQAVTGVAASPTPARSTYDDEPLLPLLGGLPSLDDPVDTGVPTASRSAASTPAVDDASPVPERDDSMPDDVADAVRRALAAIERAAADPAIPARLGGAATELPTLDMPSLLSDSQADPQADPQASDPQSSEPVAAATDDAIDVASLTDASAPTPAAEPVIDVPEHQQAAPIVGAEEPVVEASLPHVSPPAGLVSPPPPAEAFAPPTVDMRAEAVYEQAAAERAAAMPEPGQASVVFVDDAEESTERTSALKRLIGSLRKGR